jgi:hypothetical protein
MARYRSTPQVGGFSAGDLGSFTADEEGIFELPDTTDGDIVAVMAGHGVALELVEDAPAPTTEAGTDEDTGTDVADKRDAPAETAPVTDGEGEARADDGETSDKPAPTAKKRKAG